MASYFTSSYGYAKNHYQMCCRETTDSMGQQFWWGSLVLTTSCQAGGNWRICNGPGSMAILMLHDCASSTWLRPEACRNM